jgi:tyrosinase
MKKILIIIVLYISVAYVSAQTIRKPWREMNSNEMTAYVNAVNALYLDGTWQQYVSDHNPAKGFAQHFNDLFLPWHTMFLYYMEQEMGVPLVYWDWEYNQGGLTEWSASSPMFKNASGGTSGLFERNLNSTLAASLGRSLSFGTPPNGVVASYLSISNYSTFRQNLEGGLHAQGHNQIGGVMSLLSESPTDPTFYLHHSMVDKVYQHWVDDHWDGSTNLFATTSMATITGKSNINPNSIIDRRVLKIWYAENGVLSLNKYSASGTEVYQYTSGSIEAIDFIVPSSANVEFRTNGKTITLDGGFTVNAGGIFEAKTY